MGQTITLTGGNKMSAYLTRLAGRLGSGAAVNVGFLEGATYPPGKRKQIKRKGKVIGRKIIGDDSTGVRLNVAQVAFWNEFGTTRSPPRPFFRLMIKKRSPGWGLLTAAALKKTDYKSAAALEIIGDTVKGELQLSITELHTPPLAQRTIDAKGFDKPLIDTSTMINAVDYAVKVAT